MFVSRKQNEQKMVDKTVIKNPNTGGYLIQNWNVKYNDRNNNRKKFIKINKINQSEG